MAKTKGSKKLPSERKPKVMSSEKAGIQFPVQRCRRKYADRIGNGAAVFMAAALEYLVAEILELGGNAAKDNRKVRINPRHLVLAIRNDDEISKLLRNVTIAEGGVLPYIHSQLLPKAVGNEASAKSGPGNVVHSEETPAIPQSSSQPKKAAPVKRAYKKKLVPSDVVDGTGDAQ
ncbi:Histone H2A [Aphelenchoides besseyi]|nr:Histone H2A [Aphelenchoides besseyi]